MTILHASNTSAGNNQNSSIISGNSSFARMGNEEFTTSSSLWAPTSFTVNPTNGLIEVDLPSAQERIWAAMNHYTPQSSGHTGLFMSFTDSTGNNAISVFFQSNTLQLRYWNGSVWIQITEAVSTRHNTINGRFNVHIRLHATEGFIRVYRGEILVLHYTGNTIFNSVSQITKVRFHMSSTIQTSIAELLVSTKKTIGKRCYTATINGAGVSNNFTSGIWSAVDDENVNTSTLDTDFMESTTSGQIAYLALDNLANTALPIHAVAINARALKSAGSPESISLGIRVGGVDYHGADQSLPTVYTSRKEVWNFNPNTAAPWVAANIPSLEAT